MDRLKKKRGRGGISFCDIIVRGKKANFLYDAYKDLEKYPNTIFFKNLETKIKKKYPTEVIKRLN